MSQRRSRSIHRRTRCRRMVCNSNSIRANCHFWQGLPIDRGREVVDGPNINIILTDTYGNLITAIHKVMSSPTATNYRIAQYDTFRKAEKVAYLQKQVLTAKLESQIQFLQSIHRPEVQAAIDGLAAYSAKIENARDKRDLLTIESRAGHL